MSIIGDIRSEIRRILRNGIFGEEKIQATKTGKGTITISIYRFTNIGYTDVSRTGITGTISGDNVRVKVQVNNVSIFDEMHINTVGLDIRISKLERNFRTFSIEGDFMMIEYIGNVKVDLKDTTNVEITGSD
jgi:hypothetical protein